MTVFLLPNGPLAAGCSFASKILRLEKYKKKFCEVEAVGGVMWSLVL